MEDVTRRRVAEEIVVSKSSLTCFTSTRFAQCMRVETLHRQNGMSKKVVFKHVCSGLEIEVKH